MQIPDRIEEDKIIMRETTQKENAEIRIEKLKINLSKTDYQAIKFAEGQLTEEEYAEIKVQRQAWRDEIDKLEIELGLREPKKPIINEETQEEQLKDNE